MRVCVRMYAFNRAVRQAWQEGFQVRVCVRVCVQPRRATSVAGGVPGACVCACMRSTAPCDRRGRKGSRCVCVRVCTSMCVGRLGTCRSTVCAYVCVCVGV